MHDELEAHIERYADDLIAGGMPRHEAVRRARMEFGGLDAIKEDCREALRFSLIDELRRNITFGFRMLRKSPSFSIVAVVSLAVAIGLNTTAFSLVNVVLFRALPVASPERLVFLDTAAP